MPKINVHPAGVLIKQPTYTTGELAGAFDVAARTVSKWADTGKLDHYRIPGGSQDRRFTFKAVVAFARKHRLPLEIQGEDNQVLLVTANQVLADQFRIELGVYQCPCRVVDDWLAAGQHISGLLYETVVIDLAMGRDTTLRACAVIKQIHPNAAVVVLAYEDETNQAELFAHGATLVVKQPCNVKDLVNQLIAPGV